MSCSLAWALLLGSHCDLDLPVLLDVWNEKKGNHSSFSEIFYDSSFYSCIKKDWTEGIRKTMIETTSVVWKSFPRPGPFRWPSQTSDYIKKSSYQAIVPFSSQWDYMPDFGTLSISYLKNSLTFLQEMLLCFLNKSKMGRSIPLLCLYAK